MPNGWHADCFKGHRFRLARFLRLPCTWLVGRRNRANPTSNSEIYFWTENHNPWYNEVGMDTTNGMEFGFWQAAESVKPCQHCGCSLYRGCQWRFMHCTSPDPETVAFELCQVGVFFVWSTTAKEGGET